MNDNTPHATPDPNRNVAPPSEEAMRPNVCSQLDHWAELKPDECQTDDEGGWRGRVKRGHEWVAVGDYMSDMHLDRIQRAVQEAVQDKGWGWWVNKPGEREEWMAKVYVEDADPPNIVHEYRSHEDPAPAFLAAYLSALESRGDIY